MKIIIFATLVILPVPQNKVIEIVVLPKKKINV